ncbi:signal peptide-containing protein [Cryptosporidium felis]|nr:signal peptide-containing protein [Cryptosporidium felis]
MIKVIHHLFLLLLFLVSKSHCGDMISAIIESAGNDNSNDPYGNTGFQLDLNARKPSNFKQGNKRWFKAKKDLMKFTPQRGIELGKKIARNASIGVLWKYEPGLLLAEELVSPCFGIISYYPNLQVTVMKGERFLGIVCDAREHKPISYDRFKWYIAIGDDLTFTPRYYVKEGAFIKEGQELGYLSRPAKSVGRVAIKSRARCSGIIVLCKSGVVNTGEEFLRISCDIATSPNDVKNSLVDESHTSLLDQSDLSKSIPKLRGLAQISSPEAQLDGDQIKLPQIMNPNESSTQEEDDQKIAESRTNSLDSLESSTFPNQESKKDEKSKSKTFFDFELDEDDGANVDFENLVKETSNQNEYANAESEGGGSERKETGKLETGERGHEKEKEKEKEEKEKEKEEKEKEAINAMIQSHKRKGDRKGPNKEEKPKKHNEVSSLNVGGSLELEGLSSSIVGEYDLTSID